MDDFESEVKSSLLAILKCVEANSKLQMDTTAMFFEIVKNQEAHYQRVLDRMEEYLELSTRQNNEMILRSEARVGKINEMVYHLVSLDESSKKQNLEYLDEFKFHIRKISNERDKAIDLAKTLTSLIEHMAQKPVITNSNKQT